MSEGLKDLQFAFPGHTVNASCEDMAHREETRVDVRSSRPDRLFFVTLLRDMARGRLCPLCKRNSKHGEIERRRS